MSTNIRGELFSFSEWSCKHHAACMHKLLYIFTYSTPILYFAMEFQDISSPQGSFTFVFIPARDAEPLAERTASLAGGLEDEQVQKVAKLHFFGETPLMFQMVDICTVYLPSPSNGYIGVSLYSHADSALPVNGRATKIAKACGHSATVVYGDAFISRCYDNEEEPWMRRDLFASEVCEEADWVIEAGASNRGRNMDAYTSGGSAGKVVHQMMDGTHTGRPAESAAAEGGTSLVRWTQTNDDIEVSLEFPAHSIQMNLIDFDRSKFLFHRKQQQNLSTSK